MFIQMEACRTSHGACPYSQLLLLALLQNQIYSKKISEDITLMWKGFLSNQSPAIKEVSIISLHRSWGQGEILARKYLTPNRKVTF